MSDAPAFYFNRAIVRRPAASVIGGLRAQDRGDPTLAGVAAEQDAYIAALEAAGVSVSVLPALEAFPDSIFVEDPALVFPEGAILLRPGAPTRLEESRAIAPDLRAYFDTVLDIGAPGFAEGGDILTMPDEVMIGLSSRTDLDGAGAVVAALAALGRDARIVETPAGVLHFKTDCSLLDAHTILATARLAKSGAFAGYETVIVPEGEESAANALRVNDAVFVGADFPRTIELLDGLGYQVIALKTAEIGKIDAGLSCMSLRWRSA